MSQPFRFTRGDSFQLPFVVYERLALPGEQQVDVPKRDITNDVIRYTAKRHPQQADDGEGVIRKDGENADEITITNAAEGKGVVVHRPEDTKGLPNRHLYLYTDLEVNTEDGTTPQTVIAALLIMETEITIRTTPI